MPARKTHGTGMLQATIRARGMSAIDRRSRAWRDVQATVDALCTDLGGRDQLSQQQLVLVDLVARTLYLLNHVDSWLLSLDTPLVGKGKQKQLVPLVKQRGELARHLESLLVRLGLERRQKNVTDLDTYLAERYGDKATEAR